MDRVRNRAPDNRHAITDEPVFSFIARASLLRSLAFFANDPRGRSAKDANVAAFEGFHSICQSIPSHAFNPLE